jgi:hypothetical protein
MPKTKTRLTETCVEDYFASIPDPARRSDCEILAGLMTKATKQPAKMWGTSIVGFGSYHYRYESGREGDSCIVGFSSRKSDISIYGLGSSPLREELITQLGKHRGGKGCISIRRLSDIDLEILKRLVASASLEKKRLHGQPTQSA